MPLINFRTNLTSLQYGLDRPGGGYSGQPYIQNPIEGPDTPPATIKLFILYFSIAFLVLCTKVSVTAFSNSKAIARFIFSSIFIFSFLISRIR